MRPHLQSLLAHIRRLPEELPRLLQAIEPRARLVLSTPDIYGIRQIILTGSGDSLIAATSVVPALRAWTGLPVQAVGAMEASRYLALTAAPRSMVLRASLVVCVSHSGEAARVVEAAQRTRAAGALTLALTAHPDSRLGRATMKVLDLPWLEAATPLNTFSYCASLLGLYLLGIRIAEARMRISMDRANALRRSLSGLKDSMATSIACCEAPLATRARAWEHCHAADILGSGPAAGAAAYCAAKLIEAAGIHAVAHDIEEFFHLGYFIANPTTLPTVVFAPARSLAAGRVSELLPVLQQLGRPVLLLTDDAAFGPPHDTLALPGTHELLTPLLDIIPAVMLAAFWADQIGAEPFRGHDGPWRSSHAAALVRGSAIQSLTAED
jgi:glutamine---fructose-6-phosphate transaminase (isomerizing)